MASLLNGFGGPSGFGTESVDVGDDTFLLVNISLVFGVSIVFFDVSYLHVFINNNGNIGIGGASIPTDTGTTDLASLGYPILAPLLSDVDTTAGAGTASAGGTSTGANKVWVHRDTAGQRLIVTWDDVAAVGASIPPSNAYQAILTHTGNGGFSAEYRYETLDWQTANAIAGYSDGTAPNTLTIPIDDLLLTGNTGEAGRWLFNFPAAIPPEAVWVTTDTAETITQALSPTDTSITVSNTIAAALAELATTDNYAYGLLAVYDVNGVITGYEQVTITELSGNTITITRSGTPLGTVSAFDLMLFTSQSALDAQIAVFDFILNPPPPIETEVIIKRLRESITFDLSSSSTLIQVSGISAAKLAQLALPHHYAYLNIGIADPTTGLYTAIEVVKATLLEGGGLTIQRAQKNTVALAASQFVLFSADFGNDFAYQLFSNLATSTLALDVNEADSIIYVQPGDGVKFASPAGEEFELVTIQAVGIGTEILKMTARVGDALTVERGQEDSFALNFPAGTNIYAAITAGTMQSVMGLQGRKGEDGDKGLTGDKGPTGDGGGSAGNCGCNAAKVTQLAAGSTQVIDQVNATLEASWWVAITALDSQKVLTILTDQHGYVNFGVLGDWGIDCPMTTDYVDGVFSLIAHNRTASPVTITSILLHPNRSTPITTVIMPSATAIIPMQSTAIAITVDVMVMTSVSIKRLSLAIMSSEYVAYNVLGDWTLNCPITADLIDGKLSLIATNNTTETLTVTALLVSSF